LDGLERGGVIAIEEPTFFEKLDINNLKQKTKKVLKSL
jgi:hypothetical protein